MLKKIILMALCLSLFVVCFPEITHSYDDAMDELFEQLMNEFPNLESIKTRFGDEAKWQESTVPSPHDDTLELQIKNMEYSGVEINTLSYVYDDEESFFITLLSVKKAGIVKFLGLDVGSARDEVLKTFGRPQIIEGNEIIYHDEDEFNFIKFVIENNEVTEMRFIRYLD